MRTVTVGRVLSAHGVSGGCKCAYHTDYPERLKERREFILRDPATNKTRTVTVKTLRLLESSFLISFNEITQREEIMLMNGWLLEIPAEQVPADTAEDEFYFFELEGMEVISAGGELLGVVVNVMRGVNQDIIEVRTHGKDTRLVPFASIAVLKVDRQARKITLQPDFEF
jgi:16S rRNA processing protein RimM